MLTVLFSLLIILLTVAVVALFAMMGELASRVENLSRSPSRSDQTSEGWATEIDDFPIKNPVRWPAEIRRVPDGTHALLIVVSTSCKTCADFLDGEAGALNTYSPVLVVSGPSRDRVRRFLDDHPGDYDKWPKYIDLMGQWSRDELGIDVSPSAVLFEDGRPTAVFGMSSAASLADIVSSRVTAPLGGPR